MSMPVRASSFRSPPGLDNVNSDADDNDNDFVGDDNLESFVMGGCHRAGTGKNKKVIEISPLLAF
jgi:hypothetical protein